ncbi:UNVERIFIED_CONTAM: hypothetical protein GTU68_042016 [Idotea baltica]|nr:hypothetical protein [Idotea baltica]
MVWLTQIVFYGLPWLQWNDRQAVLFDLGERKFHIFSLILYPQDFIYLSGLLVISAMALFLFTTVAGRLWCGYTCPQTVYTEIFLWIERKVEGDRNKRIKLDNSPFSPRKLRLKTIKHALWILFALWTGFTFVGYFTPIIQLFNQLITLTVSPWQAFWILFYGFATYGNAGFMREQVCKYMCPYARFQGVMFDRDTLVITYDQHRGDPRGSRSKKVDAKSKGLGDCVDCGLCVQVCPTGIDIREGQQYECIGCAACIDACDKVMEKVGYPKKLIRYDTLNRVDSQAAVSAKAVGPAETASVAVGLQGTKLLRPRVIIYSLILLTATVLLLGSLGSRINLKVDVMRDRGALSREVQNGLIENVFRLLIINSEESPRTFNLSVEGLDNIFIDSKPTALIDSASHKLIVARVRVNPEVGHSGSNDITFIVQATDDASVRREEKAVFYLPHQP